MKILKRIKDNGIWIGECRSCGTIIEAQTKELKSDFKIDTIRSNYSWEDCVDCDAKYQVLFFKVLSYKGQQLLNKVSQLPLS